MYRVSVVLQKIYIGKDMSEYELKYLYDKTWTIMTMPQIIFNLIKLEL
jgi:hypothetical protein